MKCQACGNESNTTDYVGKLVFVEAERGTLTDKEYSNYDGGEYFVIRQTPHILYCVKLANPDEYNGRQIKQIPLLGNRRFNVLSATNVKSSDVEWFVRKLWENAHKKDRGENVQWCDSVYSEAKAAAREMARLFNISLPEIAGGVPFDLVKRVGVVESTVKTLTEKLRNFGASL
jgi:hypothetical protein